MSSIRQKRETTPRRDDESAATERGLLLAKEMVFPFDLKQKFVNPKHTFLSDVIVECERNETAKECAKNMYQNPKK